MNRTQLPLDDGELAVVRQIIHEKLSRNDAAAAEVLWRKAGLRPINSADDKNLLGTRDQVETLIRLVQEECRNARP